MAGEPQPAPVVSMVDWDSAAQDAGLLPNDEIQSLNGVDTQSAEFCEATQRTAGSYPLKYSRNGQEQTVSIDIKEDTFFGVSAMRTNNEIGVDDPSSQQVLLVYVRSIGLLRSMMWIRLILLRFKKSL